MRAIAFGVAVVRVGASPTSSPRLTARAGRGRLLPADVLPDAHHDLVVGGVVAVLPILLQLLDQRGGQF